jgi:tetratricopeptide (TPR) repeat protein
MTPSAALLGQDAATFVARGDSLLAAEKLQRAMAEYEKAVKAEESVASFLGRARGWWAMERMDRFLLDIERVLRMDSTVAQAHYLRSLYSSRGDDHLKTIHHATQAITHTEDSVVRARALLLRGMARADMKQPAQAIDDLQRGLDGGVEDVEAMTTLSRLYDGVGRYEEALAILERLCELEPNNVGHWSNRGFELIQLERYEEALTMIEQALRIDKDEPVALSNRAYVRMQLGNDKEAWQDVERSLRSYPANPYALRTRAMLRLRKGETNKACDDLVLAKALGDLQQVEELIKQHCADHGNKKK